MIGGMKKLVRCYGFGFLWASLIAFYYLAKKYPGLESIPSDTVTAGILVGAIIPTVALIGIDKRDTPRLYAVFVNIFSWTGALALTLGALEAFDLPGLLAVCVLLVIWHLAEKIVTQTD